MPLSYIQPLSVFLTLDKSQMLYHGSRVLYDLALLFFLVSLLTTSHLPIFQFFKGVTFLSPLGRCTKCFPNCKP